MNINIKITRSNPTTNNYAIIRHRWRISSPPLPAPPDTCPFGESPKDDDKGTPIPISPAWFENIKAISPDRGYRWIVGVGNMVFNTPGNPSLAESIGCGGNFVEFDQETDTHIHVVSYNWKDTPPADGSNWLTRPTRYWKACAIKENGQVINVGAGLDAYWAYIAKSDFWIHKKYVEIFERGLDYRFYGCNIYNGSVPLLIVGDGKRTFPTQWRISTLGVVPPVGWG